MKRFIVSLLVLIPLFTGCTNVDTQLTLNNDKSASVVTKISYKGNLANKSDKFAVLLKNNYKKLFDNDYVTEITTSANDSEITAKKNVKNIKYTDLDLTSLGFVSNSPEKRFIEVKQNIFVTSYNIDMVYNYPKVLETFKNMQEKDNKSIQKNLTPEYLRLYGEFIELEEQGRADFVSNFEQNSISEEEASQDIQNDKNGDIDATFSVKLPSFASYNNADIVKNNTYIWNIRKTSPTVIRLQYVIYSGYAISFILLAGIALIIYLAKRLYRHETLKRVGK